ncbi:MAG: oxidative damage protection protein [Legionellales bacterium]|nr:oxidative damage protection protein [Legionellales bacterium]HAV93490.1 oxidative damage protection protein [Pseudomonadota bacterium]
MHTKIMCQHLGSLQTRFDEPPYPGKIGKVVLQYISQEAWQLWLEEQTKLINENRLSPLEHDDRKQLEQKLIHYLGLAGYLDEIQQK